jgi:hypothetical protein
VSHSLTSNKLIPFLTTARRIFDSHPKAYPPKRLQRFLNAVGILRFNRDYDQRKIILRPIPSNRIPRDLGLRRHV